MIEAQNLTFTYPKQKSPAVNSINFKIKDGEIFGFLGPSGAGKSTTQKILTGILRNYSGVINIMNKNLQHWKNDFYEEIGVGFELPNHYLKLTAIENLKFFASFYSKKAETPQKLLELVDLQDSGNTKVEQFSKGMKMRLNFVRALMHNPQILFFDEPTSGLDPVNARRLKDIILAQKSFGKTIFLTTHNMHDADELCDRVAFIVDGKINVTDSPKQLKLNYGKRKVKVEYENSIVQTKEFDMNGLGQNPEFLELIQNHEICSIHSEEATLDEIFIKVTGKTLN